MKTAEFSYSITGSCYCYLS